MFHAISWSAYISFWSIALLLYYGIVILKFYRVELSGLGKRRPETVRTPHNADESTLFTLVHECMDDLHQVFAQAAQQQQVKEEVLMAIQIQLQRYAALKGTAFQVAINHHIAKEAQQQCSLYLADEELKRVWNR